MHIVMFDPGNFTPDYVAGLAGALGALGERCSILSSPPLFEADPSIPNSQVSWLFSPWLARPMGGLRRRLRLRRLLRAIGYPLGLWRTWRHLQQQPPGVLHLHWALVPWLDTRLLRNLKQRGWRIVLTAHDPLPERGLGQRFHRAMLALVDATIVHTQPLAEGLLSSYPELAGRVHVIPHGAIAAPIASVAEEYEARAALGLPQSTPLVVFCGMLKPYKGIPDLLRAFAQLRSLMPAARLVIAGAPLMPLRRLQELMGRLELAEVIFRPAFIPRSELPLYFIAADLIVAPYRRPAASGIVTQAQSYGKPVLVTRLRGLADLVEADDSGWVVPPGDPQALAAVLRAALAEPDVLRTRGARGRARILREHNWSDVARRTLPLYRAQ